MAKLADEITITMVGEIITLRPSLRHAMRLERRPGSFAKLLQEIDEGSLTAAFEIISDHHHHPMLLHRIFDAGVDRLRDPLERYVLACAGVDFDDVNKPQHKSGKSVTFSQHLRHLYQIGAGWLGWPPDVTLDATPAEITEAYEGRVEMLRSIFGGSDDKSERHDGMSLDDKFKTAFASFGTVKVQRSKKAA